MATWTVTELRAAANKCRTSADATVFDRQTADSLLDSLELDMRGVADRAANIERADQWFNKPFPLLPGFMERWHT